MEGQVKNGSKEVQNENSAQAHQKKKSAIPVLVRKTVSREVLGTLESNHQNKNESRKYQEKPIHNPKLVRKAASPSAALSRSSKAPPVTVKRNDWQRAPESLTASLKRQAPESAGKKPRNAQTAQVSLVEEQQRFGLDLEFQKDSNALRSILTNSGISVSASGTVSEMKCQRATEGQGRQVYTPGKYAAQLRNSVYSHGSRMSLMDSYKQYQKFFRQTKGLEEESASASPILPRGPTKVAVAESPLVKGMKSQKMVRSVYPKWSHSSLFSPSNRQNNCESSDKRDTTKDENGRNEVMGTPRTPLMAFSRIAVTPDSVKSKGAVAGIPWTPSQAYNRVVITPARRILVQSCTKLGSGTASRTASVSRVCSQSKDPTRKRLRWADILRSCSPDVAATQQNPAETLPSKNSATADSGEERAASRDAVRRDPQWREAESARPQPILPGQAPHQARRCSPNTADAAADRDCEDDSPPLTLCPASTPLHRFTEATGSFTAHTTASSPLSAVSHHRQHVQQVLCRGDAGDGGNAAVWERRREEVAACGAAVAHAVVVSPAVDVTDGSQVGATSSACGGRAPHTDKLARLQVLQEQMRGIQNEMQLLKMAMQKEQEGDSNGNHVSDVSASGDQTSNANVACGSSNIGQNPLLTDTQLPLDFLLRGPRLDLPQSHQTVLESVSMASPSHSARSGNPIPDVRTSQSTTLCNDMFCNTRASSVDSDCSSSPDINSNILSSGFKRTELKSTNTGPPCRLVALEHGTGDASPDEGMETKLSVDDGDGVRINTEKSTQSVLTTAVSSSDVSTSVTGTQCSFGNTPKQTVKNEDLVNIKLGQMGFLGENPFQADVNFRQSVDMDVEDGEVEDSAVRCSPVDTLTPLIPQSFGQLGAVGHDQSPVSHKSQFDQSFDCHSVKTNPVSVIVRPSAVLSPAPHDSTHSARLQVSPPIWTTLALQSAASTNRACSATEPSVSVTPAVFGHQAFCTSSSLPEIKSLAAAISHAASLSPRLIKPDSPTKRASRSGTQIRSSSPTLKPSRSPSKRSPLRSTLRQRQGMLPSSALKNPDVFLEALLEDECALYAGRLQSFFKNLETSCDRKELPDPVARILNEGDDMHFIPICNESTYNHRPVCEGSAFASYIPV